MFRFGEQPELIPEATCTEHGLKRNRLHTRLLALPQRAHLDVAQARASCFTESDL
jgi:hypothetical protein